MRAAHARPMHATHPEGPLGKCHELLCSHGDQLQEWLALYGFSRPSSMGIDGRLSHVQHYYSSAAAPAAAPTAPATGRGPVPSIQVPGSARDKHAVQYKHICTALRAPFGGLFGAKSVSRSTRHPRHQRPRSAPSRPHPPPWRLGGGSCPFQRAPEARTASQPAPAVAPLTAPSTAQRPARSRSEIRRSKSRAAAVSTAELLVGMIGIACGVCGGAAAP